MSERMKWIEYKNARILYVDYSNLKKSEDIINLIKECEELITKCKKDEVLLLINILSSIGNTEVIAEYKKFASNTHPYVKKTAVIGAESLHKILIRAINSVSNINMNICDSEEKAKEYLITV